MDSSRKRRAVDETPTTGSATKKLKLLNSNPAPVPQQPSAETVQKVGLKLIGQINNATDKTGRTISDAFIDLPDRVDFHDYYVQTKMPISVSMVEDKIRRNGYATITEIESDLKRMVQNAKEYNMPKSDIYEDAERIRKLVYNYMKIHNPAYTLDPNYQSFCTPIPETKITLTNGGAHSAGNVKAESGSRGGSSKPRASLGPKASEPPSERKSSAAPSASAAEGEDQIDEDVDGAGNRDFTGKTFQEAQQMIVAELISHAEDGVEIFTPFVTLPSRKLEDYYKTIRHPVSLKSVQKRTRGIHGRAPPTGLTDFKTWDAFEEEISFIWRNAREYNLDGSEMYELAGEFEEYFKAQLAEAKSKVEEPAARIKLAAPKKSGITLNLGQHRSSPTPGVSVDNEALARQRQMVQAGVNGQQTQTQPTLPVNGAVRPSSQGGQDARPSSSAQSLPPASAPVKNERVSTMSPAATMAPAVQAMPNGHTNGMMPPPLQRHMSGSPYPAQPTMAPPVTSFHFTAPSALPPTPIREYPISQSLLPVVTLSTHPQLRLQKPYSLAVPPHASLSQQSRTITLPSTHYYVQIAPTISRELSMGRAYKMFVTVNGTRLTQRDTQFHADSGKRTHMYEGSLASGVNRIEVEIAAAKVDGDGKGLDVEKVTIFANLTR